MTRAAHAPDRSAHATALPPGVALWPLQAHRDERGLVAEFFHADWQRQFSPAQWTMTVSEPDVMRGVHVHLRHTDWLVVFDGTATVGLSDLRPGSPAQGRGLCVELRGDAPAVLRIPPGVAHGLLFRCRTIYALGLSHPYDLADELGCDWRDPGLGIDWPAATPRLSARDAALPPLRELAPRIPPWQPD